MLFNRERYSQKDSDAEAEIEKSEKLMNWHDLQSRSERTFIRTMKSLCQVVEKSETVNEKINDTMTSRIKNTYASPKAIGGEPMEEPYRIKQKNDLISNNNKARASMKRQNPSQADDTKK